MYYRHCAISQGRVRGVRTYIHTHVCELSNVRNITSRGIQRVRAAKSRMLNNQPMSLAFSRHRIDSYVGRFKSNWKTFELAFGVVKLRFS